MKKLLTILCFVLLPMMVAGKQKVTKPDVSVSWLRVENMEQPLAIDTNEPRFSWLIKSEKQDVRQTAYQLIISDDKGEVWNSGKVNSDQQLWVRYGGQQLKSATQYSWKVKVWTNIGESEWSNEERFGIGLLKESQWSGRWIGIERLLPGEERGLHTKLAARYLRKEFELDKPVKRAIAYVAGIGLHELHVNGLAYNRYVMQPMPTDYRKTILYNTYDITESLKANNGQQKAQKHCVGIVLGNGRLFPMRQTKPYKIPTFGFPKCRINILITFEDGTTKRISTDEKWRLTANGPIRSNNEYDGEIYDARQELTGWDMPGYNDKSWFMAERTELPTGTLRAQMAPGMVMEPLTSRPSSLTSNIYDFHQNMAGWIAFTPTGKPGDTIRVKYAEKLKEDGTLYLDNFRDAQSEDIYICGSGLDGKTSQNNEWHPVFSYHGFRYAQITGPVEDVHAYTVSDEMQTTGRFECSDATLNQVMKNAWWGIYSNYKGMPVDCPQRNERQPWLGDRTMGSLGESYVFNNERLYTKWMRDICESQREDGVFCDVAPAFWNYYNDDVTWPAALPFGCDMLWRQYGNREAIDKSYPYIKRWLNHLLEDYLTDGIITTDKYGDWCVPPEKLELIHSQDPTRKTDGSLISTAYVIRVMQLLEQWGCEATHWQPIREQMTKDFNRHFLTVKEGTSLRPGHVLYPDSIFYGNIATPYSDQRSENTATANLLALSFGIVPEQYRQEVAKNVVENIIIKNNAHVPCGVIGISWLLRGLSDNGFSDVAYMIATQKSYPSWGYMAENGATTIWELWNGDKASPKMNSGNHVMLLGDLVTWCYQYLGGIRPTTVPDVSASGYKHFRLQPAFDIPDCSYANVSFDSPYGTITSNWKKTLQHVEWDVQVPCNTTADVCLPDGTIKTVGSGKYHFSCDIPTSHPAITKDEFLYEKAAFPQCHSASIVETRKGDLVATYFGGKHERNPDVCIYVSIKKKGAQEWSKPILAADGVFKSGTKEAEIAGISGDVTRKACWNPVIFEMPNGELWLFFKIGTKVADWTGWLTKSKDGGKTWSKREALPKGFLGPVKNKPELIDGRLLCPSSTENNGWKFHMEIYDLKTKQWKYVGPVEAEQAMRCENMKTTNVPAASSSGKKEDIEAPDAGGVADKSGMHPIDCIQPSILKLKDGRLQVLMRTRNGKIATSFSSDNGDTWTKVTLLDVPNNQSGTDAVTLQDGRHVLIYNNFETLPGTKKGVRTPLSIAISDDGTHWRHALTLEDSPISQYSYPSIIQGKDGKLHAVYTWRRLRIAYKEIDINKLK